MHGIGVDADVRQWFDVRVPKPTVKRHHIARALEAVHPGHTSTKQKSA